MTTNQREQSDRFVPVSEKIRERIERSRLGDSWPARDLLVLLGIAAVAAALRFWQVEVWSVSAAEADTWRRATTGGDGDGFALPVVGLRLLFDNGLLPTHGEGWLRLPFLFAGTLAVPLLALVGDALVGRRAALLAAGMLALHPWHVEVCQSATGHGAALTASLLALGSAYVGLETRSVSSWLFAAAFAVLAGLCHPIGWLTVYVAFGCWQLERFWHAERRDRMGVVAGAVIALTATVVAALMARPAAAAAGASEVAGAAAAQIAAARVPVVALALLVPLLMRESTRQARCLATAALLSFALPLLLGLVALPVARDQALLALPALLLLAANGALASLDRVRAALGGGRSFAVLLPGAMVAVAVVADLAIGSFLYTTARRGSRPDWRQARDQIVRAAERPGLTVLAAAGHDSLVYYLRPEHWRAPAGDPHPGIAIAELDLGAPRLAAQAAAAAGAGNDLFVVLLQDELAALRAVPAARDALRASFELLEVLPSAGTRRDETVYVHRWVGTR